MEEKKNDYTKILLDFMVSRRFAELREMVEEMQSADLAAAMEEMEDEDKLKIFRILKKDTAADVFPFLEDDTQQFIIMSLSTKEASAIIDNLYSDDAADLLDEMPANIVKKLLANASPDTRKDVNQLLQYPDDSAGSVMTVEYIDFKADMTVDHRADPQTGPRLRDRQRLLRP